MLEGQVGQCGNTFDEAKSKAGTFHGKTPCRDPSHPHTWSTKWPDGLVEPGSVSLAERLSGGCATNVK